MLFWAFISNGVCAFSSSINTDFLSLQTYLEQTKTKFSKDYKAMNPAKITTTVGLNSRYFVAGLTCWKS